MVGLDSDAQLGHLEKEKGNIHYKKKEFQQALECYNKAIQHDPRNMAFYSNKAAVYFEQGEYEKCRDECAKAVETGRCNAARPEMISKAFARIGNSYLKERSFQDAKRYFLKALDENLTSAVNEKLKICDHEIEEEMRLAYVNPELSIHEKKLADDFLENGDFESSLRHYTEASKRNPSDARLYLSRVVPLAKLGRQEEALVDCDKCLAVDPNLLDGYLCKGATLESLQRFDRAMDSYSKALERDPNHPLALKAYYRCLERDYKYRNSPEYVAKRTFQDPQFSNMASSFDSDVLRDENLFRRKVLEYARGNPADRKKLLEYGLLQIDN